ncbi:MAG: hypothetical protein GC159_23390 [Phycisphaera sp.]|nr:hypothetical protein [Phycisphaera sp.]
MWFSSNAHRTPAPTPQPHANPSPSDAGSATATLDTPRDLNDEIRDVLQPIVPWFTSLLFHLGLIVLALFIAWVVIQPVDEEPIVPIVNPSLAPRTSLDTTRPIEMDRTSSSLPRDVRNAFAPTQADAVELSTKRDSLIKLIGLAGGASGGKLGGIGDNLGKSNDIGKCMFRIGEGANKILFVVDASGSLIDTMPFVIKELKDSIVQLTPDQEFGVLFFQAGEPREAGLRGMHKATADYKKRVLEYIDLDAGNIVPRGVTDPVATLQRAMSYKPELVLLLSDNITGRGKYEVDRAALLDMLDKLNRDHRTMISTIQFLHPDPLNTLKEIATRHGGEYKYITAADLGLR